MSDAAHGCANFAGGPLQRIHALAAFAHPCAAQDAVSCAQMHAWVSCGSARDFHRGFESVLYIMKIVDLIQDEKSFI